MNNDFTSRFSALVEQEKQYKNTLDAFIKDAFDVYGYEFIYKAKKGAVKHCEDVYFELEDKYGEIHTIYPTRIYRTGKLYPYQCVDGYDANIGEYVRNWTIDGTLENRKTIALFIDVVLNQKKE